MPSLSPFHIDIPQSQLDELRLRLSWTRFPERETIDDWSQGVPLTDLRELVAYWQDYYDLRRLETRLNALPQFLANIDGLDIHFIHVRSPQKNARPLIMTHGWPGSVVEFLQVIGPLTDPVAHGANPEDAFHVVCPSLPGYGFSGKPAVPGWGVERIARAWAQLMEALGYEHYFAQDGDWGAAVTTSIAQQDRARCRGIHINMLATRPPREQRQDMTQEETAALEARQQYRDHDAGYSKQQATRPQTIGYSLVDSPAGLLAWKLENFSFWTNCATTTPRTL